MIKVTKKIVCKVTCSADDWGLYDIYNREVIATALNKFFERRIEDGLTRQETYGWMEEYMKTHSKFGAADTEGYNTLETLLKHAYGA